MFKKGNFTLIIFFFCIASFSLSATQDPLPSWNETPTKKKILGFIKQIIDPSSSHFVKPEDRIAAFDEDGTLWVEQPLYTEFFFAIQRIKEMTPNHPEWNNIQPFQAIISNDLGTIKKFSPEEIVKLIAVTHSGMSIDEFHTLVKDWMNKAIHPRYKKNFTELVYQPMREVMDLLKSHGFSIYIVSGGGQEFMRAFAEKLYGIPPGHIIGTTGKVKYQYNTGSPELEKLPSILFVNDKEGKPEGMNLIIGKRPIIAFGNSVGDQQMLEWTQANPENSRNSLQILIHHDDARREYAYGANSKIGTFSDQLMTEAIKNRWIVVSMKNDWKTIFSWEN